MPSLASTASRRSVRCRFSTSGQPSPSRFRRVVDPSMSENSIVTVPSGSAAMGPQPSAVAALRSLRVEIAA
jgi:hypothetical protein